MQSFDKTKIKARRGANAMPQIVISTLTPVLPMLPVIQVILAATWAC